ncbi:MAG TPA: VOC family protein [Chloroflexota bacterium]|nr:VOC family protein [Chloroflexota bacterium]
MISGGVATIYVSDLDRAVKFYTDTLGLKLQYQVPGWAQVEAGSSLVIGLHPTHPGGPQPGVSGSTGVGFELDEPIDAVYAKLSERGVKFDGPVNDTGHVKLANFKDPDGNPLYLSQNAERPRQAEPLPTTPTFF